jgi:hypothetical protein
MRAHTIRYLAELNLSQLDDTQRHQLVTGINQSAPGSALVKGNPAMQATVASIVTADGGLTQANDAVAGDRQKLRTDIAAESTARGVLDGFLRTFVAQAQAGATSPADLVSVGLIHRSPAVAKKLAPEAPVNIVTKVPQRGHGKVTVAVEDVTPTRLGYVAESSPDPIGTWTPLGVGHGKTRVVTGATGTKIWVRFAAVRGTTQSEWSTPTLLTIP